MTRQTAPPGSLFYDSGSFTIASGYRTVVLTDVLFDFPDTFVWTVEFSGLAEDEKAGLLLYDPPTTGSSADSFWRKQDDQWELVEFPDAPGNFAARVEAGEVQTWNDNFSRAQVIPSKNENQTIDGTTVSATIEPGEPTGANAPTGSVWFRWTPPYSADLQYTQQLGDTSLRFFTGDSLTNLVQVPDDIETPLRVEAGTNYYLQVAVTGTNAGPFLFTLFAPPENDNFAQAIHLFSVGETNSINFLSASVEAGEPALEPSVRRTVWYRWSSPASGDFHLLPGQVQAEVFEGETLSSLVPLMRETQFMPYYLRAGVVYHIRFSSGGTPAVNSQFQYVFEVKPGDLPGNSGAPANDSFSSATFLRGASPQVVVQTAGATLEDGEAKPDPASLGQTVWYCWSPEFDGRGSARPGLNVAVAVFRASAGSLERVNRDFLFNRGELYYFQLDPLNESAAAFTFLIYARAFTPITHDHFVNAIRLRSAAYTYDFMTDSTLEPDEPLHKEGLTRSVWYIWQAPVSGRAQFIAKSDFIENPFVAVYSGDTLNSLQLVGKGESEIALNVKGGITYRIALAFAPADRGDVQLNIYTDRMADHEPVPGNLLRNASFEEGETGLADWQSSGPIEFQSGFMSAHGSNWIILPGLGLSRLSQSISAVPGRLYNVSFAFRPPWDSRDQVTLKVNWDGAQIGAGTIPQLGGGDWFWTNFYFRATSEISQLEFENVSGPSYLDGVSVVWEQEPVVLLAEPSSMTAIAGGDVTLSVTAAGAPPLNYQWFKNDAELPGATSSFLSLTGISADDAGLYHAVVSNLFSSATSQVARITVDTPLDAAILVQPSGATVPEGAPFALSVLAAGSSRLSYQWFRDGIPIAEAVGPDLVLPSVSRNDAGVYTIRITAANSSVLSLPAEVRVTESRQSTPLFVSYCGYGSVYDVDRVSALAGSNFVSQIYAGPDELSLKPVTEPLPFGTGQTAGWVPGPFGLNIPTIEAGANGFVQLRVWDRRKGATFEHARAAGGRFGSSAAVAIGWRNGFEREIFIPGFYLQAGLPNFTTGRIQPGAPQPDGTIRWVLVGAAGLRYVIEKAGPDMAWEPFTVLLNETGIATFVAPFDNSQLQFFRSRILD